MKATLAVAVLFLATTARADTVNVYWGTSTTPDVTFNKICPGYKLVQHTTPEGTTFLIECPQTPTPQAQSLSVPNCRGTIGGKNGVSPGYRIPGTLELTCN